MLLGSVQSLAFDPIAVAEGNESDGYKVVLRDGDAAQVVVAKDGDKRNSSMRVKGKKRKGKKKKAKKTRRNGP